MKQIILAGALLFATSAQAAPTPASGELNGETGTLNFSGGPFMVPNSTSDRFYLGGSEPEDTPVVCDAALMNCDVYALKLAIPEATRSTEGAALRVNVLYTVAQPSADPLSITTLTAYLHDANGTRLAISEYTSDDNSNSVGFELPLNSLPNGLYELRLTANYGFGVSYTAEAAVVQSSAKRTTSSSAGGALAPLLLLGLAFSALARRVRR